MNAQAGIEIEVENAVLLTVLKQICIELAEQKEHGLLCHNAYNMAQRAIRQFSNWAE